MYYLDKHICIMKLENLNRRGIMTPTNRKNFWEVVGSRKREENMGKYKKLVIS